MTKETEIGEGVREMIGTGETTEIETGRGGIETETETMIEIEETEIDTETIEIVEKVEIDTGIEIGMTDVIEQIVEGRMKRGEGQHWTKHQYYTKFMMERLARQWTLAPLLQS